MVSAYIAFLKAKQPALMAKGMKMTETASVIASEWKALTDADKATWHAEAATQTEERQKGSKQRCCWIFGCS